GPRALKHDPEKWKPVFRKDHASPKDRAPNRRNLKPSRSSPRSDLLESDRGLPVSLAHDRFRRRAPPFLEHALARIEGGSTIQLSAPPRSWPHARRAPQRLP